MILKRHAHAYGTLSRAAKAAVNLDRAREAPVACPHCATKTDACDLLAHIENRCEGPQEAQAYWRWVPWRQAIAMGVPGKTLSRWASNGQVRFLGAKQDRKYLLRDLAVKIAQRNGFRRR